MKKVGGVTGVCIGRTCTLGEHDRGNLHWAKDRRPYENAIESNTCLRKVNNYYR